MTTVKQGKLRHGGRAAPAKRRRRSLLDAAPNAPPDDGEDATPAEAPTYEIEAGGDGREAEGAADDWAGIDTVADMVEEPFEGRRRR